MNGVQENNKKMPEDLRGNSKRRKGKRKIRNELLKEHFREYCSSSSIHGVQYVGDPERPNLERGWWLVIFVISFGLNSYLIYKQWHKWQESPVIVSFSETTTPVWQVPFPAITICLQATSKRELFHFQTSTDQNLPQEADKRSAMSLLCSSHIVVEEGGSEVLNKSSIDFLFDVAPTLEESLLICKLRNELVNCSEVFSPVITEDGLCFTSNTLNHSDLFRPGWSVEPYPSQWPEATYWSLDKGFAKNSPIDTYPRRALDSGDKAGFFVVLNGNMNDLDTLCRGPITGFKIMLHNPAEIPTSSQKYIRIPVDQELLVWVQPKIMTTSDSLRGYSYKRRQCFYSDERRLRFFSIYTERNCELECLTNFTLKHCGCVSFYMPRDESTPVCGGLRKECTVNATYNLRKEEVLKSYEGLDDTSCNCLPSCTAINYEAEVSQSQFDWKTTLKSVNEYELEMENDTMSRITIIFSDTQFTTSHRSELFGVIDFLANVGGLLGLFSGISFLSFLEIFYFGTLRFWGKVQSKKKEEEAAEELEDMSPKDNQNSL